MLLRVASCSAARALPRLPSAAQRALPALLARGLAAPAGPPRAAGPAPSRHLAGAADSTAQMHDTIQTVLAALLDGKESCFETFEPSLGADGVLLLDIGDKGTYSLQATDGGQLLLFSPVAGPKYYNYDAGNGWWSCPQDGHLMIELLVRELMHSTSVCINL